MVYKTAEESFGISLQKKVGMASKEDWMQLIDQEEGELLVISLIQEIIQKSQALIFERHIDNQLLPYTVEFAKETLMSLVDVTNTRYFKYFSFE